MTWTQKRMMTLVKRQGMKKMRKFKVVVVTGWLRDWETEGGIRLRMKMKSMRIWELQAWSHKIMLSKKSKPNLMTQVKSH